MLGETLGHYRLVAEVGAGAMGVVYRARDTRLDRDVAVKVLPATLLVSEHARRRFRQEALALSSTNHPNIATVYDFDSDRGIDFLVMEFVPGESLSEVLARGRLSGDETAALGVQLAQALDAAHAKGIVHRDIKPGNLRRTPDGRLKVLDFGVARREPESNDPTQTDTLSAAGTLPYMAPEQLRGRAADGRSDIYSAGVVLFEMATGRRPFSERNPAALMRAIVETPAISPRVLIPDVPPALEGVILKTLEKQPDRRYQSARELAVDLRRIVEPSSIVASTGRRRRFTGRSRWIAAGLAAAAVVAVPYASGRFWRTLAPAGTGPAAAAPAAAPLKLAMLPVRDLAHTGAAPWNDVIAALFSGELTGSPQFGFVDPLSLSSLLRGKVAPGAGTEAARGVIAAQGIALAFEPVVMKSSGGYELRTTVLDTRTGESGFSTSAAFGNEEALPDAVHTVASRLATYAALQQGALSDRDVRPWISLRTQNIEAVKAFAQANQYVFTYQPGEVEKLLRRAIDIDPDFIAARLWLISGLLARGNVEEARIHYAHLRTLESRASPFEVTMIAYAGARIDGDLPAQARHLELALRYSPGNNILLFNLAGTLARLGKYDQSLDLMRPLVEAGWGYPPLYSFWGLCAIQTGRVDEARRGLEKALRLPAIDPNVHGMLEALAIADGDARDADRQRLAMEARNAELRTSPSSRLVEVYEMVATRARDEGKQAAADALAARARQLRTPSAGPPDRRQP